MTETFNTKYGKISLLKNEGIIGKIFRQGKYWEEDNLLTMRKYIDPNRDILEIGGHCGTSSIVYSKFTNKKIFVYEPQQNMYELLVRNIYQNNLQHKIIPFNLGVFCYSGVGTMNNIDLDGGGGNVKKRYTEEQNLDCNFGGICLGTDGEAIHLTTIDEMKFDDNVDIGYIHCDAQGSENFIFSKGTKLIMEHRPIILYENNIKYGQYLYNNVCKAYPNFKRESEFDVKNFCMNELKYKTCFDPVNNSYDTLLIP